MLLLGQNLKTITTGLLLCVGSILGLNIVVDDYFDEHLNGIEQNESLYLAAEDTVRAEQFGVRADYNGHSGTDNQNALQQAINYCSNRNKILKLPSGRIMLNSYAKSLAAKAHGNILELRTNTKIIGDHSEIVIGSFFHDKNFIVFSGLNSPQTQDFTILKNIHIKNLTINFNAGKSIMKTKYLLRKGIELGHTIIGEISYCKFINGDISCGIATGFGNKNISTRINIHHNLFKDLTTSPQNKDHTSVYLNSTYSSISHNQFINNPLQGKLVSCAAELHSSHTKFTNNTTKGYTRMMFLVAANSENKKVENLTVTHNWAEITNAAIYLWLEDRTSINNILISANTIKNNHIPGYSMLYNGTQGIIADARVAENAVVKNMEISNNKTTIQRTEIRGRAVNYATKFNFKSKNNLCNGCKDGLFYP